MRIINTDGTIISFQFKHGDRPGGKNAKGYWPRNRWTQCIIEDNKSGYAEGVTIVHREDRYVKDVGRWGALLKALYMYCPDDFQLRDTIKHCYNKRVYYNNGPVIITEYNGQYSIVEQYNHYGAD